MYIRLYEHVARLSQTGRATLHVVENFASYSRSFEITPLSRVCAVPNYCIVAMSLSCTVSEILNIE